VGPLQAIAPGPTEAITLTNEKKPGHTQQSQPKKGKPVEIPVPKRSEFDRLLAKATKPSKKS